MKKFKEGDQVVCVKTNICSYSGFTGAVKGKLYVIYNIVHCKCKTNNISYDVGIPLPPGIYFQVCQTCHDRIETNTWYHNAKRFRIVDWFDCRDQLVNEVMKPKIEIIEPEKIPEL